MVDFINITASFVTAASLIFVVQVIFKWWNAPRFIVGVLPLKGEREQKNIYEVGKNSYFDEYHFEKKFLAKRLHREKEIPLLQKDVFSSRMIKADNNGFIDLPIAIQNTGNSEAGKYKLVISFNNPDIRIADVASETLEIDGLYVQDPSVFQNKSFLGKLPGKEIQRFNKDLNLTRDYLSLTGSLASFAFEWIALKIKVPVGCNDFSAIFRIDCQDFFFYNRVIYGQHIKIDR